MTYPKPDPKLRPMFSERNGLGGRIAAWHRLAEHPFFKECYDSEEPLIDAMLMKLDEVHRYLTAMDEYDPNPIEESFWDDRTTTEEN